MSIALIDYNMGNLGSVLKALKQLGTEVEVIDSASELAHFSACILPGVGSFGDGMENLSSRGFTKELPRFVAADNWFLGICLGMQMLLESSPEAPGVPGLGILQGACYRFDDSLGKVPHIGWNAADFTPNSILGKGLPHPAYFYFVHSYYVPAGRQDTAAACEYLTPFSAALERGRCCATQFHPEKSQRTGLALLKNFLASAGELHDREKTLA